MGPHALLALGLRMATMAQPVPVPPIHAPRCPPAPSPSRRGLCPDPCWDEDRAMDCQNASGFSNRTIVCCFDDGCYSSDPRARYNSAVCCGDTGNTAQCTAPPADPPHPSARRLQDDRRIEEAFAYGDSLLGTRYGWWTGGAIPLQAPAWSAQGPPPAAKVVKDSSCFCAGVTNLMLRKIGAKVPCWEGEGCGGTGAYGKYFASVIQPFNLSAEYPRGTLVGRCKGIHRDLFHAFTKAV